MRDKKTNYIIAFVIFPLLVGLACTCGMLPFGQDTSIIDEEVVVEPVVVITTEVPLVEEIEDDDPIIEETIIEEPEEIEEEVIILPGEELIAYDLTWFQEERDVFVTFHLKNQYQNLNLEGVEYRILLYDAEGEELRNNWNTMPWLFANEEIGVAFRAFMPEDSPPVASVTLEFDFKGESSTEDYINPFTINKLRDWEAGSKPIITGMLQNNSETIYTDVRINYICYDAQDEVVGGGYTYVDFVPGYSEMGFHTLADTYGEVAYIVGYPVITYNSKTYPDTPEFWQSISILDHAYHENRFGNPMGGLVIQNNLADTILKWSVVIVSFYDADGYLTTYGSQKVPLLFPGASLGLYPFVYSQSKEAKSVDYDIIVLPGQPVDDYEFSDNVFRVDSVQITGESDVNALVTYTNTYNKSASEVDVFVLAYDQDGVIIGGARSTIKEPLPAGSSAESDIYIYYNRDFTVAEVRAWVLPNTSTKFE